MKYIQELKSNAHIYQQSTERDILIMYAVHDLVNISEKLKALNIDEMADDLSSIADSLR